MTSTEVSTPASSIPAPEAAAPRIRRALPPPFTVTPAAIAKISAILARPKHDGALGLRIGVNNKGCSGKSYTFEPAFALEAGEEKLQTEGITLVYSPMQLIFLIGTEIDWEEDPLKAGFVFRNPNEKGRCGCGESFHV